MIEGLKALKRPSRVRIQCDSAYVVNAHRQGWIRNWQRNGWRTAAKKPVENQDLWQDLLAAEEPHDDHVGARQGPRGPRAQRARRRARRAAREQAARDA